MEEPGQKQRAANPGKKSRNKVKFTPSVDLIRAEKTCTKGAHKENEGRTRAKSSFICYKCTEQVCDNHYTLVCIDCFSTPEAPPTPPAKSAFLSMNELTHPLRKTCRGSHTTKRCLTRSKCHKCKTPVCPDHYTLTCEHC